MERYEVSVPRDRKRPVRLALRTGSSVVIQPGEKRQVRPALARVAKQTRGCQVKRVTSTDSTTEPQSDDATPAVVDREAEVRKAVEAVMHRGNPDDFTQQGRPRKTAIRALVDFEVTLEEIDEAFNQLV